jgi:predicted MFS family arabinose efflux permease
MSAGRAGPSALAVLLVVAVSQALVAVANSTLPAIAPKLAEALRVDTSLIGYQVSLLFGVGTASTLMGGGFVARFGSCRTMQISSAACALGLALAAVPHLACTVAATVCIGFALGIINSPAAELIVRYTPPERRNLFFSLKQSGVPLGGMIAALTAPLIAVRFGWQWSMLTGIVWAVVVVVALQFVRGRWDASRPLDAPAGKAAGGGAALVWRVPALRWVALSGFCYSAIQRCVLTFTVAYLVTEGGYGLVQAGVLLSMVQAGGICGRPFWGVIADRTAAGNAVLVLIGAITVAGCILLTLLSAAWPTPALAALFFVLGLSSVGWNGVMHAELARLSPPGQVGAVAGGGSGYIFAGVLVGPALFSMLYAVSGSYTVTFWLTVACGVAGTALLLAARRAGGGSTG